MHRVFITIIFSFMSWFGHGLVLNNPYPAAQSNQRIYYTSFTEQPKTLDPARSYSSNEYQFIAQIYEPLLEYDYFTRPYQLVPLSASAMPTVRYFDARHRPILDVTDATRALIAYSVYTIELKRGMYFQPHPAFSKDERGQYRYHHLLPDYLNTESVTLLSDIPETGTREVVADDYIYEIKRLANPAISSPIYGLMSQHIVGFKAFADQLPPKSTTSHFIDLRKYPMAGVKKINDYAFEITVYGNYPQFLYWLAMPFFSPIPWEADAFYSQENMKENNFSLSWYPIGSGPFMLVENNPNRQMVLKKNPNYRLAYFPTNGSEADKKAGYLAHAGEQIPLLDQVIFTLEKESTPRWNKFLQGYYDLSGVSMDGFDQAIQLNPQGRPHLTPAMRAKHIRLTEANESNIYYLGFNMRDPIVGGLSERARKLRLAISIAVNFEEYIAIFYNGRGTTVQGPIPPGILPEKKGPLEINPYVYRWQDGKAVRLPIQRARQLMAEAGYPHGIDPKTRKSLILNYDVSMSGSPDEKAQLDWIRKQFHRLGIDLNIRATQYNRFQEKMRLGNAQIFYWGWNADYPDPESFLFLLYGPNGKVRHGGENASNYHNAMYDRWFEQMKNRPNDAVRDTLIRRMVDLVRHDAPWVWGINTETLVLTQQWVSPMKPNAFSYNTLKYMSIDLPLRAAWRAQWNQAIFWPLGGLLVFFLITLIPFIWAYRQQEKMGAPRAHLSFPSAPKKQAITKAIVDRIEP